MSKMFVFDLDGTLLNSEKGLSRRTRNALENVSKTGYKITIATARPPRATRHLISQFSFPLDAVYYNGSLTNSSEFGEFSFPIRNETFRKLLDWLSENDSRTIISIEESDKWFTTNDFDFCSFFHVSEGPSKVSFEDFMTKSPNKVLLNECHNPTELRRMFYDILNIVETDRGTLVQIMSKESSKENAIEYLLGRHGIDFQDTVCFGDDYNDVGLFEKCGEAIAMGNAIDVLKRLSTHITDSNDNDGVALYIEERHLTSSST